MRTRVQNADQMSQVDYRLRNNLTGVYTDYPAVTRLTASSRKRMEDVVTPWFSKRRSQGEVIMNPMTSISGELQSPMRDYAYSYRRTRLSDNVIDQDATWVYLSAGQPESYYDGCSWAITPSINTPQYATQVAGYPQVAESEIQSMRDQTLIQAHANVSSPDMLALVSLFEIEKSVESLCRLSTLLSRFYHWLLVRGRRDLTRRGLVKRGCEAASQWLEYRYGFMQLYYDAVSIGKLLGRDGKQRRVFTSAMRTVAEPLMETWDSQTASSTLHLTRLRENEVRVVSGVLCSIKPTCALEKFFVDAGLNNLLLSGWELVPFSFIVDWVVDISGYISAWSGNYTLPVVGSWQTVFHTYKGRQARSYGGRVSQTSEYRYEGFYSHDSETTEVVKTTARVANPQVPELPPIRLRLNWKRLADAVALAMGLSHKVRGLSLRNPKG